MVNMDDANPLEVPKATCQRTNSYWQDHKLSSSLHLHAILSWRLNIDHALWMDTRMSPCFHARWWYYSNLLFSLQHSRFLLCRLKNCFPILHSLRETQGFFSCLGQILAVGPRIILRRKPLCSFPNEKESSIAFVESSTLSPLRTTYPHHKIHDVMSFVVLREGLSIPSKKTYLPATESSKQLTIRRCLPWRNTKSNLKPSDHLHRERLINTFYRRDRFTKPECLQQLMVKSADVSLRA